MNKQILHNITMETEFRKPQNLKVNRLGCLGLRWYFLAVICFSF